LAYVTAVGAVPVYVVVYWALVVIAVDGRVQMGLAATLDESAAGVREL
jgi:hypothetical protein